MTDTTLTAQLKPGRSASYLIVVEGALSNKWSGRLGGMQIQTRSRGEKKPVTTLQGEVQDQAALFGVLNSLYEMHLPILKVDLQQGPEN